MAKTREVLFRYPDNRDPDSSAGIPLSGSLVILNPGTSFDVDAATELGFNFTMVQVRGTRSNDKPRTEIVVGLSIDENGLVTPFGDREAGQVVAKQINLRAEQIRPRK